MRCLRGDNQVGCAVAGAHAFRRLTLVDDIRARLRMRQLICADIGGDHPIEMIGEQHGELAGAAADIHCQLFPDAITGQQLREFRRIGRPALCICRPALLKMSLGTIHRLRHRLTRNGLCRPFRHTVDMPKSSFHPPFPLPVRPVRRSAGNFALSRKKFLFHLK